MDQIVPIIGILSGIIIPVSVFIWLYYDAKGKRDAIVEIAKHMDDPNKTEKLLTLLMNEKKSLSTIDEGALLPSSLALVCTFWEQQRWAHCLRVLGF